MASSARNQIKPLLPLPECLPLNSNANIRKVAKWVYEWGWPLVNVATRAERMRQLLDLFEVKHLRVEGWPIGYNSFTLQTESSSPDERLMCCPNSSLLYGGGAFKLGTKGAIAQVPVELVENNIRWLYSFYDARSLHFGACASHYPSEPGFYLIIGPDWDGSNPDTDNIPAENIIECTTDLALLTARIFIKPSESEDWIRKVNIYPAEEYQSGVYQEEWWENVENKECPDPPRKDEFNYVNPRTFFRRDLPNILSSVKEQDGEANFYRCMEDLVSLAASNARVMRICIRTARETERTIIQNGMLWSNNGTLTDTGWYFSEHSGEWPVDEYALRTASAKSNLFQNRRSDTHYYFMDDDSNGNRLNGRNTYKIIFDDGLPPANGPWSVTVYTQYHFLYANPFSFSDRDLPSDPEDPLVIYAGPDVPDDDRFFIRTPRNEPFCLYLRAYWMDENAGPWVPPKVEKHIEV
jgi:hypothetical protein